MVVPPINALQMAKDSNSILGGVRICCDNMTMTTIELATIIKMSRGAAKVRKAAVAMLPKASPDPRLNEKVSLTAILVKLQMLYGRNLLLQKWRCSH